MSMFDETVFQPYKVNKEKSLAEFEKIDENFELAEKVPENVHIEKITVAISRNDLKIMLAQRMQNDVAIDNEFNALTDKYCHLFGFMDWLQAYHKL